MHNVLLIERDERLLRERAHQLLLDGYEVYTAQADRQARLKLAAEPDAVVLCSADGDPHTLRLLRELRAAEVPGADARVPILAVGADDEASAVRWYRAGADVALPSRSSALLVAAGLEALARRVEVEGQRRSVRQIGNLRIDEKARVVQVNHRPVKMTRRQFDLLQTLSARPNEVITRAELTRRVWGFEPDMGSPRLVDGQASRVNRTLAQAGAEPRLQIVRGVGYRLTP
jgi:DNA-binding response OmpR family regulator